ncbi:MAG: transposase [Desulfobacteraceae bacterium]|nr:transposase [Desulfobacteraceae bacterium]
MEYKQYWRAGQVFFVSARNSSRTCSKCGHTDKENRKTQSAFICPNCGFSENAGYATAINVLAAGYGRVSLYRDGASRLMKQESPVL